MKDEFKKCQLKHVGIGGMDCPCCNPFKDSKGKDKKLNRMARHILKQKTDKLIKNELKEMDNG